MIFGNLGNLGVFGIIATILAIVAVVLAFIFIVPEKKRANLNKFGQFLHDTVNFKFLIVEKILQALYIFVTAYVILIGFFMLFYVQKSYFGTVWFGGYGLLIMLLGPIVVRLVYELIMMFVLLVKNTISINNKLKSQNGDGENKDPLPSPDFSGFKDAFRQPAAQSAPTMPVPPVQPAPADNTAFCPNCGQPANGGDFCAFCGTKLK